MHSQIPRSFGAEERKKVELLKWREGREICRLPPSRIRSLPLSVWENGVWGIGVIDTLPAATAIQTAYPSHACLIERAETQKMCLWHSGRCEC